MPVRCAVLNQIFVIWNVLLASDGSTSRKLHGCTSNLRSEIRNVLFA